MSYNFGQIRSSQIDNYINTINVTLSQWPVEVPDQSYYFYDICGDIPGTLSSSNSYYLAFSVARRSDATQLIYLVLLNTNAAHGTTQQKHYETFIIPKGSGTINFRVIFTPNDTYNKLVWQMERFTLDYETEEGGVHGRIAEISNVTFGSVINILDNAVYSKIGVQGPPGLLMCINHEPIRIGRTGIYEFNETGIDITSIGFAPTSSNFILDYEYNDEN